MRLQNTKKFNCPAQVILKGYVEDIVGNFVLDFFTSYLFQIKFSILQENKE